MFFATAVVAALQWKDFVVLHHLRRLRAEPGHFVELLQAEAGSARQEALHAFLKTPAGAERLLENFLDELGRWYLAMWPKKERFTSLRRGLFGFGATGIREATIVHFGYSIVGEGNSTRYTQSRQIPESVTRLWGLFEKVQGREIVVASLPQLRFIVLPVADAEARSRLKWPFQSTPDNVACVLERVDTE